MTPLDLIASNTTDMVALLSKGFFPNGGSPVPVIAKDAETAGEIGGATYIAKYGLKDILKGALDYSLPIAIAAGQKNALPNGAAGPNAVLGGKNYRSEIFGDRTIYFLDANDRRERHKVRIPQVSTFLE